MARVLCSLARNPSRKTSIRNLVRASNSISKRHQFKRLYFFVYLFYPKQASTTVYFWIQDINDNSPRFLSQHYNVTVKEVKVLSSSQQYRHFVMKYVICQIGGSQGD